MHLVTGSISIGPMRFSRNMVALVEGEDVWLVNTVRLDDRGLKALDGLGRVAGVVRVAGFHGSDDPFYKDRYGCPVYAVRGQTYFTGVDPRKGEIYFEADVEVDSSSALPVKGWSLYTLDTRTPEAILRIPAGGGTLISGDSLQNWAAPDRYFNLLAGLGMRVMGFIKPHQIGPAWAKQLKPDPAKIRGILDLDFENVLPAHGEPVLGGAREKYRPAIDAYTRQAGRG